MERTRQVLIAPDHAIRPQRLDRPSSSPYPPPLWHHVFRSENFRPVNSLQDLCRRHNVATSRDLSPPVQQEPSSMFQTSHIAEENGPRYNLATDLLPLKAYPITGDCEKEQFARKFSNYMEQRQLDIRITTIRGDNIRLYFSVDTCVNLRRLWMEAQQFEQETGWHLCPRKPVMTWQKIMNLPTPMTREELCTELFHPQNRHLYDIRAIRCELGQIIIKRRKAYVQAPPEFREALRLEREIVIRVRLATTEDCYPIRFCLECAAPGHNSDECREPEPSCAYCADTHWTADCPSRRDTNRYRCVNCQSRNFPEHLTRHSAFDRLHCPVVQQAEERHRRRTEHRPYVYRELRHFWLQHPFANSRCRWN